MMRCADQRIPHARGEAHAVELARLLGAWVQYRSIDVRVQSDSPPRPYQLANGEYHNTSNQKQKDRDCQVGLLLEFLEPFVDPRRSPEKDRTNEEKERDSGGHEGYDLENHCALLSACTYREQPRSTQMIRC